MLEPSVALGICEEGFVDAGVDLQGRDANADFRG